MDTTFSTDTDQLLARTRQHSYADLLHRTARRNPDKLAVVSGELRATYADQLHAPCRRDRLHPGALGR